MPFKPNLPPKRYSFVFKNCTRCGTSLGPDSYAPTSSYFFPDKVLPICNSCVKEFLRAEDFSWAAADKLCQMADIPFIPREWETLREANGEDVFPIYTRVFQSQEYESIGWSDYYEKFKELKQRGLIEDELPVLSDEKFRDLSEKWGSNYDREELIYLEDLYNGIL